MNHSFRPASVQPWTPANCGTCAGRAAAAGVGLPWQAAMDSIRPRIQQIWRQASAADRRRFLRHARPWWDIHRHRIAPPVAAQIGQARATGQLTIEAGRIVSLVAGPRDADIVYTPRGHSQPVHRRAARVINCTGPASDMARSDDPLIQSLLAQHPRPSGCVAARVGRHPAGRDRQPQRYGHPEPLRGRPAHARHLVGDHLRPRHPHPMRPPRKVYCLTGPVLTATANSRLMASPPTPALSGSLSNGSSAGTPVGMKCRRFRVRIT